MTTKSAMNFRTTYILMGGAALLLAGLAVYVFFGDHTKPAVEGTLLHSFAVQGINPAQINGLEIDKGDDKIVLTRQEDGRWRMVQPIEARADSALVQMIVGEVLGAKRDDQGVDITPNLAVHGLDKPAVKVTLKKGDQTASLSLGKITTGGDKAAVYVLSSDEPGKPQAVRKNRLGALFKTKPPEDADTAGMVVGADDLRTRKLLGEGIDLAASMSKLTAIKLTEKTDKGLKVVAISRNGPDKAWHFDIPAGYGNVETTGPAGTGEIKTLQELLNAALSIEVHEPADYLTKEKDLSALGLDPNSPGVLRVDIDIEGIGPETLWISRQEAKKERDKVYVRYDGDPSVAQVNAVKARLLSRFVNDPSTLRERTLVKLRPDKVDALQISIDGKSFELAKGPESRWKVYDGDRGVNANRDRIMELINELTRPNAVKGFPPADATDAALGFDKPAVEIKIWEDGAITPGTDSARPKLKELPTTRILFGKKDLGDVVYVRRYLGFSKVDVKMLDSLLPLASRGRLAYVEIGLKSFDADKVQKLTFPRGLEIYEIERVDKDGKSSKSPTLPQWKIVLPESKKGKLADTGKVLAILNAYQALATEPLKVVAEKPTADQLASMGLDPAKPRFQVAIKIKDGPDRVYTLGNDVPKQPLVYAGTSMSDYVFEASKQLLNLFTEGEIVDPVIYRIDPSNVKGMKLTGWVDLSATGMPQMLELERKPGGLWSAKGNLSLDNAKVEDFLLAVSQPRAESIVQEKAKPEQGLDVAKGALQIEIDLIEGKPVTLTLGNRVSKDSPLLFAESNQAKGEVLTLKGEKLFAVKEKPAALK